MIPQATEERQQVVDLATGQIASRLNDNLIYPAQTCEESFPAAPPSTMATARWRI
jgi:hypothetical protein